MSSLGKYTVYDLKHRLNKLKCCFAEKTAELVKKQKYGKPCKDEKCNVQILGAYVEMLECLVSEGCDCSAEWITDGSLVWNQTTVYTKDQVIKVYPREASVGSTSEFLYFRWLNQLPPTALDESGQWCNSNVDNPSDGFYSPCYSLIGENGWSVCGNIKVAWQSRGQLTWQPNVMYKYGDIIKFMGGGSGSQESINEFYISTNDFNQSTQFHESENWVKLVCYDLIK